MSHNRHSNASGREQGSSARLAHARIPVGLFDLENGALKMVELGNGQF